MWPLAMQQESLSTKSWAGLPSGPLVGWGRGVGCRKLLVRSTEKTTCKSRQLDFSGLEFKESKEIKQENEGLQLTLGSRDLQRKGLYH